MKLAFVIYDLKKGGAERVVSLLSKELSKNNEVHILIFDENVEYEYGGKLVNLNCKSVTNKIGKIYNIFKRRFLLKKIFKKEKYDNIYCFMETAYIPAILTGYEVIASVRNNPYKYSKYITTNLLPHAKKVVSVSKDIEDILKKEFNILNTITINNPVDFRLIDKLKNEEIEIKDKYIMAIGRLHYQKGFDILIKAYLQSQIRNEARLFIFGEGKLRSYLQKIIDKHKLNNLVILQGITNNVYKYLYNTEIFILSSRYEGFPNVVLEALACEAPVIATDCPTGPREIIKNGYNGLLVESENVDELARAMDKLFFDENLKHKLKVNDRKSIEHLSVEKIATKWLGL